jgi:hypothetical protein
MLLAQTPPPVSHVKLSLDAARFLDSLADEAREHRIENAGCLVAYAVSDSVMTVTRFGGAHYHDADSVTIRTDSTHPEGICDRGVPTVHSHVAWGGNVPASEVDRNTAKVRGTWNLLLNVLENGWVLRVY